MRFQSDFSFEIRLICGWNFLFLHELLCLSLAFPTHIKHKKREKKNIFVVIINFMRALVCRREKNYLDIAIQLLYNNIRVVRKKEMLLV